jgi:hypothetical protein
MKKKMHTEFAEYEFDNSVLFVKPNKFNLLEIDDVKDILHHASAFTKKKPYYTVILGSDLSQLSVKAKKYLADNKYNKNRLAIAYVVTSFAYKMAVKSYIDFDKPTVNSKIFSKLEDAMAWIESLKKEKMDADKEQTLHLKLQDPSTCHTLSNSLR